VPRRSSARSRSTARASASSSTSRLQSAAAMIALSGSPLASARRSRPCGVPAFPTANACSQESVSRSGRFPKPFQTQR
jgi:hypothetical protein